MRGYVSKLLSAIAVLTLVSFGVPGRAETAVTVFAAASMTDAVEEVAKRLNLSARTLRRRLHEQATSYKLILEQVRVELANHYLSTSRLTIGTIGERLGYTEQSSFSYAYKKLTGITPNKFRQLHSQN